MLEEINYLYAKYLRSIFISIQDQYLEKQKSFRTLATSAENWKKKLKIVNTRVFENTKN